MNGELPTFSERGKEEKKAVNYSLRLLTMRGYSTEKLRQKLLSKGYSSQITEKALTYCTEQGYLSDQKWSESFIRLQVAKKYGLKVIEQKLKQHGISSQLIEEGFQPYLDNDYFLKSLSDLLKGRYKNRNLEEFTEKQKVIASLMRRGFTYEEITKVLP